MNIALAGGNNAEVDKQGMFQNFLTAKLFNLAYWALRYSNAKKGDSAFKNITQVSQAPIRVDFSQDSVTRKCSFRTEMQLTLGLKLNTRNIRGIAGTSQRILSNPKLTKHLGTTGDGAGRALKLLGTWSCGKARRAAGDGAISTALGFELEPEDIAGLFDKIFGPLGPGATEFVDGLAGVFNGVGFVISLEDLPVGNPSRPDLVALEGFQTTIPSGVNAIIKMTVPPPNCQSKICSFLRANLCATDGTCPNVFVVAGGTFTGATLGVSLGNFVLWENDCGHTVFSLSDVSLVGTLGTKPKVRFQVIFALDMAALRVDDSSSSQCPAEAPTPDLLRFKGAVELLVTGDLRLEVALMGVWKNAFGWDFLHIGNLGLAVTFGVQPPWIVGFEVDGELQFGKRCYNSDNTLSATAKCVGGTVSLGIDVTAQNRDVFFSVGFSGLTLINLIDTFATDEQAASFRSSVPQFIYDSGFEKVVENGVLVYNPQVSFASNPLGRTTVTGKFIPGGLRVFGSLNLFGWRAKADILVSPGTGLYIDCSMDPIKLLNGVIEVTRSEKDVLNGPTAFVDINYRSLPEVHIEGYASIFGIKNSILIVVNRTDMVFNIRGRLFGLYDAEVLIQAAYGSWASMSFRFYAKITSAKEEIIRKIDEGFAKAREFSEKAFDSADESLKRAQQDVVLTDSDFREGDAGASRAAEAIDQWTREQANKAQEYASAENARQREETSSNTAKRAWEAAEQKLKDKQRELRESQQSIVDARKRVAAWLDQNCGTYKDCSWYEVLCHAHNGAVLLCREVVPGFMSLAAGAVELAADAVALAESVVTATKATAIEAARLLTAAYNKAVKIGAELANIVADLKLGNVVKGLWEGVKNVAKGLSKIAAGVVSATRWLVDKVIIEEREVEEKLDEREARKNQGEKAGRSG